MGEVYRARDTELKREVAIKVLPEFWSRDAERLYRFQLEAQAAAALNHPNIISIYHVGQYDGSPYIVTELLQGETLRERLRRGPIPLRKSIEYAVQIAHGLAVAHDRSIVHRDLKPENLFVTKDGRVKILDFGLARLGPSKEASGEEATVTHRTDPGVVLGTAAYMSPEQIRGKTLDHRTDIFAFGTILYEMVTGKQPFRKSTSAETMTAILNEEPPLISQITPTAPPGMQRVVHRCLEKDPEQRFQSSHDLAFALEAALSDSTLTTPSGSQAQQGKGWSRRRITIVGTTLLVLIVASALAYLWLRPERVPRVSNAVPLTHDGQPKYLFGTDGVRLYLGLGNYNSRSVGVIPISGGEPTTIPAPSANMLAFDLSPDGSQVLVVDQQQISEGPLWSLPVLGGGPARRLGDTKGQWAAWSSDGKMLAYSYRGDLFVAKADGTEPRKLVAMQSPTYIDSISWSPDGDSLRFAVSDNFSAPSFLWEVSADGTKLHRLFPGWHKPPDSECCGIWTAGGRYFLFFVNNQVWALPQKGGFFHSQPKPFQLTSTYSLTSLRPSKDGKKLFVSAGSGRGELMRYNLKSGEFAPFLGGISAEYLAFSKDGQWVAYVSFPEGTLWRSKIDGSERLQLTYPPNYAMMPRWSPDGKKIVFFVSFPDDSSRIYEVSPEGGTPRQLVPDDPNPRGTNCPGHCGQGDPNWSPDGSKIVFDHWAGNNAAASAILVLDLATQKETTLPGSQGLFSPRWSPNGRYVVALRSDSSALLLFDFETQKWADLSKGNRLGWQNWSKDGQYVYFTAAGPRVLRVRVSDRKAERVADLTNFRTTGRWFISLSLAPDDSPLLLRDASTSDIYSLDWEEP
jgi:serine/threonine protein kinase/Tol biopolymer transport system component